MSTEIKYDINHMDEIILQYKQCADSVALAISDLDGIKTSFIANYKGQANDTSLDLYDKLKEHMVFLQDCFSQMETYVTYAKDTMIDADSIL